MDKKLPVPVDHLRIVACPNPFRQDRRETRLAPGLSLLEILREVQPEISRYNAMVWVGDEPVPAQLWAATYPAPGSHIFIRVIPQGQVGRMLGAVFIAIAAIAAAAFTGGASFLGMAGLNWGMTAGSLVGLAVGVAGNLALNALIPPAIPGRQAQLTGQKQDSPTLSLTGASNQANKWGPIPVILGRHRVFPCYGAEIYTEIVGNDQYLHV